MKIEKEIGVGPDYVYVYYNQNDKNLALLEEKDRWECKIGFSTSDPIKRIIGQVCNTAMAKLPTIGLLIKTNNGFYTESRIHKSLYQYKLPDDTLCGDEWFFTNPNEVEKIFLEEILPPKSLNQYCEYNISNLTDLGEVMNLHRKKVNLTYEKLCDTIEVSRDTVSRLFSGDLTVGLNTVIKVLNSLDLEITLKSKLPPEDIKIYKSQRKAR